MNRLAMIILAALLVALAVAGSAAAAPAEPAAPAGWQTIMTEGFEGAFPAAGWGVTDVSNDGFTRYWARDDFKPYTGSWSAWPASGGAHAVDPASSAYPANMNTRMIYGPFDLSNAVEAQAEFWLWLETEVGWGDSAFFGVSADGSIFAERGSWEGSLDWSKITVDLTPYIGDSNVWVRWDFYSDASVEIMNGGAFVDDITLSRRLLDAPAVTIGRSSSNITLDWPAVADAVTYEVWWGVNAPYFTPGSDCAASLTCEVVPAPTHSFTHTGASGSAADNHAYVVRAVKGSAKSADSNRAGEFDFTLVKGG